MTDEISRGMVTYWELKSIEIFFMRCVSAWLLKFPLDCFFMEDTSQLLSTAADTTAASTKRHFKECCAIIHVT